MLRDLRHGFRTLLQAKGWTVVVVLSLALGIGANAALFSAVNGMLLTTIPVRDPGSLVRLRFVTPDGRNDMSTSSSEYGSIDRSRYGGSNVGVRGTFSYPMYQQFLASNTTMTDLLACSPFGRVNLNVDGQSELASAFIASGNYFQLLGIGARLGRTLLPDDDRATATPVAVISSKYWHSRFGSDPHVVGKAVKVNNVPVTIVGVLPPEFTGIQYPIVSEGPEVTVPLALDTQLNPPPPAGQAPRLSQGTYWWLQVMGRLKPGGTPEQVQANLGAVFKNTARAAMDAYLKALPEKDRNSSGNQDRTRVPDLRAEPGARGVYDVNDNDKRAVRILFVVVAMVLLIVCANVANLLLSRATTRQKELSVRLSLGATRWRLVRQLLTESVMLAAFGGALGIVVAYWGRALLPVGPGQNAPLDWRVLAFIATVTLLTGIVFGLVPALRGTGINVNAALKETGRSVVGSRSLVGKLLLVVQVAISLVLLVGAGLFLQTLSNLRKVDVGFNPQNLLLFRVNPSLNRYDEQRMTQLYTDLLDRLNTAPGARGVAFSQPALLSGSVNSTSFYVQGRTYAPGRVLDDSRSINRLVVSSNFFDVLGIPIKLGRALTDRDDTKAPKVAVINEAAVRKFFPDGVNPIGAKFGSSPETSGQLEIVGVLRDAKYDSVRDAPPATMYVPFRQTRLGSAVFEVRTAAAPAGVMGSMREIARQIDPNLPLTDVSTQIEQVEKRFQQERFFAQAYSLFGGIALLLAAIGLFGLMSYNVSRRTNEIGIRMALGAQRGQVLGLVMRESMVLVVIGVVAGLAIAIAAGRLVTTLLFGLPPSDPMTIVLAVAVMAVVSALAGYLPARRASRVDPMVALHYE
jgi:predicted permease